MSQKHDAEGGARTSNAAAKQAQNHETAYLAGLAQTPENAGEDDGHMQCSTQAVQCPPSVVPGKRNSAISRYRLRQARGYAAKPPRQPKPPPGPNPEDVAKLIEVAGVDVRPHGRPASCERKHRHVRLSEQWFAWRVKKTEAGCWEWKLGRNANGYGRMTLADKPQLVHRIAYQRFVGPIPDGMFVLHRCDNPPCCNPEHLELGDVVENARQMVERGRCRPPLGERAGKAKLRDAQVIQMRQAYAEGANIAAMAKAAGVRDATVWSAVTGRTWKHLPMPVAPSAQPTKRDSDG